MKARTFSWVVLALVAFGIASFACGPDKPPLTPDALDPDAGAVPEAPSAPTAPSAVPVSG